MTQPEPPTETPPEAIAGTPEAQVAALILGATERASAAIMASTVEAAKLIADSLTAIPTALATPAPIVNQLTPEEIADIIDRHQIDYGGPDLPPDARVDNYEDQYGNRIAPDWYPPGSDQSVEVPDADRETYDTIQPGSVLVPGIPRLDLP